MLLSKLLWCHPMYPILVQSLQTTLTFITPSLRRGTFQRSLEEELDGFRQFHQELEGKRS